MRRVINRVELPLLALVLLTAACAPRTAPVEIPFSVRFGEAPLACDRAVDGMLLSDLRLFVHDLRLLTPGGEFIPLELTHRPPWQGGGVALLDFENAAGPCRNGSVAVNAIVHGLVAPADDYRGLAFRIGVPESLNHANPLAAPPPLNISSMHWQWLTGYKFLRAGIIREDDGFWLHLGSTRCEGTATAPAGCANANRPEVLLPGFTPGDSVVVIDLAPFAQATDLSDGKHGDCSSGPAETGCEPAFRVLGLDFAGGEPTGTPPLFRVSSIE